MLLKLQTLNSNLPDKSLNLLTIGCFFILMYTYYSLLTPSNMNGLWADDAIYILLAEYLSPFSTELRANAEHVSKFGNFPPLYPFLLSLVGTSQQNISPGHLVTGVFHLFSITLFYFWLKPYQHHKYGALLSSLSLSILPYSLLMVPTILSEPLYLMISLLIIYLTDSKNQTVHPYFVAILVALSVLARSSGLALLLAYFIWVVVHKKQRKLALIILALAPVVSWNLLAPLFYPTQNYAAELTGVYENLSIYAFTMKIVSQVFTYGHAWHHYLDRNTSSYSQITATLFLLLILPGYFSRLRRLALDTIYFPIYLCMIVIWPFPSHAERFLFPIIPIALFYTVHSINLIPVNIKTRRTLLFSYLSLILITILPSSALIMQRAIINPEHIPPYFIRTKTWLDNDNKGQSIDNLTIMNSIFIGMKTSGDYIPADACVYTVHFEAYMLHGRRFSKPLLPKHIAKNKINEKDQCKYMFVLWVNSHRAFEPGYPLSRYHIETKLIYQAFTNKDRRFPVAELYEISPENN